MSEINLNEISAADFLAAVEDGLIDLDGTVKTASDNDDFELSDLSTEDLIQALETLEEQEQDSEKVAMLSEKQKKLPPALQKAIMKSNMKKAKKADPKADAGEKPEAEEGEKTASEYYYNVGRIMAQGYADELTKVANGGIDLNELSVDEFIEYAAHLEEEMSKEAAMADKRAALMEMLNKMRGKAGEAASSAKDAFNLRKTHSKMKPHLDKARKGHKNRDIYPYNRGQKMRNEGLKDAAKAALPSVAAYGGAGMGAEALRRKLMK